MNALEGLRMVSFGFIGFMVGGLGMGIGATLAIFINRLKSLHQGVLLCLSAGAVSSLIVLEMFPESIEIGGPWLTFIGVLLGMWLASALHRVTQRVIVISPPFLADRTFQTALLLSIAISLHNIPAGITLGVTLPDAAEVALTLIIVMIAHSIPEGLLVSLPLIMVHRTKEGILLPFLTVGVFTTFSVLMGVLLQNESLTYLAIILGIAIGTMSHVISFDMVLPTMRKLSYQVGVPLLLAGGIVGYMLTWLLP